MKQFFEIDAGLLKPTAPERGTVVVYAVPDDTEKRELVIESEVDGKEYVRVKVDCLFDGDGNLFEQDI